MTDDLHHGGTDADDVRLRAALAGVDPAASLPPADPTGSARLMEHTMSQTPEPTGSPEAPEKRGDGVRRRSRLTWVVAAAAALVIVGGVGLAVVGADDAGPQGAGGEPAVVDSRGVEDAGDDGAAPGAGATPSVTELTLSSASTPARCLPPEAAPDVLTAQGVAVDAVVDAISGGIVTLVPTRFYAGEETDLVTVTEPSGDLQALLAGVDFEEGGRYLVSATDGQVTLCGFSARYSGALADVYDEAFAG